MTRAQPKYELGEEVQIELKGMKVPAQVVNHRPAYGHWDYKLELLDDGESVSDWVRENQLESYGKDS